MKQLLFLITFFTLSINLQSQSLGNWQLVGPDNFPVNVSGQINGIGRVCQIKFHPTEDSIIYAASASGGLFISKDNGMHWNVSPGTDQLPRAASASVCIDYTNDSIIYLSTGDPNYYGNDYGIYKSYDGGISFSPANNGIGFRMALEMLMSPDDHNVLVAATNDGIWKTYDGGANWVVKKNGGAFTDMKYKAVAGTSTIYAAANNGFWKSTDLGETWNQVTIPLPLGGNPDGIRIGVSPADTNRVYLGVIYYETANHYGTVYRSDDGGDSLFGTKTVAFPDIAGYDVADPGQGNYNWTMTVDPNNADIIYTGSHCVWTSIDGGYNWTKLTNWYAELHTDMHHLLFNPYNSQELWESNDGGVWLSTNAGVNWSTRSDGIAATENYHAAQSPIRKDMISIGTQDNGELFYQSNGWFTNRGGDWGSRMTFDYLDPTRIYYYENGKRRNPTNSEQDVNLPYTPTNNSEIEFTPLNNQIAYCGQTQLFKTVDLNDAPPSWTQVGTIGYSIKAIGISVHRPDQVYVVTSNNRIYRCDNALDANPVFVFYTTPFSTGNRASVTTVASDSNVVYISCNSRVYRSGDMGQTWTNISGNLPAINILKLIHDSTTANESIYAGTAKTIWYRNDTMTTWLNYSQGLPTIADMSDFMSYNNGTVSNVLRVAYYGRGTWESPLFGNANALPDPLFVADTTYGCPGLPVQFTDLSIGNPTSWSWSFPGGTPATSNLQNPLVTYNTAGIHDVTLSVANGNGSKTYTHSSYITILGPTTLPLQEGFEGSAFLPVGWLMYSATGGGSWQHSTTVGGYSLSSKSAFFDNYNVDFTGKRFAMRTPAYDLTNVDSALMVFDVAYAQYNNQYSDTLLISASTDCGQTWTPIYFKGGVDLATSPNITTAQFVPASFQWRTDSVWLHQFAGQDQVQFSFENLAYYGQIMYIDNINIFDPTTVGLNENNNETIEGTVFPNPANDKSSVRFKLDTRERCKISLLDASGKFIIEIGNKNYAAGIHTENIDVANLSNGRYQVSLETKFSRKVFPLEVNH